MGLNDIMSDRSRGLTLLVLELQILVVIPSWIMGNYTNVNKLAAKRLQSQFFSLALAQSLNVNDCFHIY